MRERGLYFVHPANEPHLINGVGTEFLEILEELPDLGSYPDRGAILTGHTTF